MARKTYRWDEATQTFVQLAEEQMSYADRIAVEEKLAKEREEETARHGQYL
jgi:hypothetical protein